MLLSGQARVAKDLKDLRDQSVFAFFMMNALFVLIVFLLQLNKDLLHIKWPFGIKTNVTFNAESMEVKLDSVGVSYPRSRFYLNESLTIQTPRLDALAYYTSIADYIAFVRVQVLW